MSGELRFYAVGLGKDAHTMLSHLAIEYGMTRRAALILMIQTAYKVSAYGKTHPVESR